ncbi:MAG: HD domain-containing protein [Nitriliruptoraceae bacterium]
MPTHVPLTGRFAEAVTYALTAHAAQVRTGTDLPYATHLLGVTALVLEHGGSELQATAAVLHDVVEDQGGARRLEDVRARFGSDVAELVEAMSDAVLLDGEPEPTWRSRKGAYVAHLPELVAARHPSCLVSLCDKLHNVRAIVADVTDPDGDPAATWARFTPTPAQLAWYYRSLADIFATADLPARAVQALQDAVTELETLVADAPE